MPPAPWCAASTARNRPNPRAGMGSGPTSTSRIWRPSSIGSSRRWHRCAAADEDQRRIRLVRRGSRSVRCDRGDCAAPMTSPRTLGWKGFRELELAEDASAEAITPAVAGRSAGAPDDPEAWLPTTARSNARDRRAERRPCAASSRHWCSTCQASSDAAAVALTPRLVVGLSASQIARQFGLPEPTMATRLNRTRKKIRTARIPYRVPPAGAPRALAGGPAAPRGPSPRSPRSLIIEVIERRVSKAGSGRDRVSAWPTRPPRTH